MIVGNGLLAKAFSKYKDDTTVLIFASGVSNSLEVNFSNFKREENLLSKALKEHSKKTLIYFSTCSIYDSSVYDRPYIQHKLAMESLIKNNATSFYIFRLSNIVGSVGNSNTIFNYLYNNILKESPFELWKNSTRNILDIEDCVKVVSHYINNIKANKTINIANICSFKIVDIVNQIEAYLNKKGNYISMQKGTEVIIEISEECKLILLKNNEVIGEMAYIKLLLNKYYNLK